MVLCVYFLLWWSFHGVLCERPVLFKFAVEERTNFIESIVAAHYRELGAYVNIRVRNGNSSLATLDQQDLINGLVSSSAEMSTTVVFNDLPIEEGNPAYYNVFLVQNYESLCDLLNGMNYKTHHFHGLYTIFIQELSPDSVEEVVQKLWSLWIINVVVIVQERIEETVAYTYDPYKEDKCDTAEPIAIGRYIDGTWSTSVSDWFPDRTMNFHGCPLKVGVVEVKPYSMFRQEGNLTVYYGLEVYVAETIAKRLNFSIQYEMPKDNIKWGMLQPGNSTGLVGMIQRREVSFGFGSLGFSHSRHTFLKWSTPSHVTQMIMGIPPKRPYTSLEKLFQPFTIGAWICIACGYTIFGLITLVLVKLDLSHTPEYLPNPLYTLWVLLMGGSGTHFRLDSWRIFIIGFIINTLVIRTLYQAGMFERLQASASLASDLDTIEAINKSGLHYTMFRSTTQFFKDNPLIPSSNIRVIQNDQQDWDEILYALSQDKLGGVIPLPLDGIAYYVKRFGKHGIVYVGKHTGFTYPIGMHFPKTTPLQEPFNTWIHKLHAFGLIRYWTEEFHDNRYWTNDKEKPEPASLKWNQISGAFFMCGVMLLMATVVFFGELQQWK
ncbi:AGAP013416-PA-like protein [Anopheles sinensis]|uniref:AGAP013416-PA-like protein n=1 Tax=Anopheles sinensis TaxID=74873 RepID=A0A084VWM6_ANOSI|nr:AGAP013416-PA-like protein [Anopheles sinensis]